MDAQTVNDHTYQETEELTNNPEVTLRLAGTNEFYRIVDFESECRTADEPFVFVIEKMVES